MIHSTAIIHSSAILATDVIIGPWTIIEENVQIAEGTKIGSHVIIDRNTIIGKDNQIYSHAVLGSAPQHFGYRDEQTRLELGCSNIVREFVTINRGTKDKGVTKIGNNNYFMSYSHVAHDCEVGNHVIFANTASIAGHVHIGDYANLGPFSGVHQFVNIGAYSFLGRATKIYQDILPYMLVIGNPGAPCGLNMVGLRRHGFSKPALLLLKQAFQIIFRQGLQQKEILAQLSLLSIKSPEVSMLIQAINSSSRSYARRNNILHDLNF